MGGLLRYQLFLAYGSLFAALWYTGMQNEERLIEASPYPDYARLMIRYAPLWVLFALGVYALVCIGYGMINFIDQPDAVLELELQIKEAKLEMKKRGISC